MTVRVRRPEAGPSESDLADRHAFEMLGARSLEATRASAGKWRDGLAGIGGLVIGAILFKGRSDVTDIDAVWKAVVTALIVGGLVALIVGLLLASSAAYATPAPASHDDIRTRFGDLRGYEHALGLTAARQLAQARRWILFGLPMLVAAGLVLWWAPSEPKSPPSVQIVTRTSTGTSVICAHRLTADGTVLRIDGQAAIAASDVVLMRSVDHC